MRFARLSALIALVSFQDPSRPVGNHPSPRGRDAPTAAPVLLPAPDERRSPLGRIPRPPLRRRAIPSKAESFGGSKTSSDALRDPPRDSFAESSLPHDPAAAAGVRAAAAANGRSDRAHVRIHPSERRGGFTRRRRHLLDGHAAGDGDALPSFPPPGDALRASIASSSAVTPPSSHAFLEPSPRPLPRPLPPDPAPARNAMTSVIVSIVRPRLRFRSTRNRRSPAAPSGR